MNTFVTPKRLTLLVIDDDEDDYILLEDIIHDVFEESQLHWAAGEKEGLALLKSLNPDICLLDINLGSTNGLELLKTAKREGYTNPIIIMTGQDDQQTDAEAQASGAADFLVKGKISANQITRAISYALTRKEAMDERLERVRAQAESRAKSRFLATLSHEMRSPLTSILGYTELIIEQNMCQQAANEIATIHRNSTYLLNLMNDVLDLSKIESGVIQLTTKTVDFEKFLRGVFNSLKIAADKKGITLHFQNSTALPDKIICDATRLRQIFINIINNAIKYTHKGNIDVEISGLEEGGKFRLGVSVKDTGIGIPPDKLQTIFEPFAQITEDNNVTEGVGLGLTISKELIQSMQGTLKVDSKLGEGSIFNFDVLVSALTDSEYRHFDFQESDELEINPPATQTGDFSGITLLIVDDLPDVRNLLTEFSELLSIPYYTANNGEEAVAALQRNPAINAIFMDIQMPVCDGYEAIRRIRDGYPDIFACGMSAASAEKFTAKVIASGFNGFLSKPFTLEKIKSLLLINKSKILKPSKKSLPRVLLIDDNEDALKVMQSLLEFHHCEVVTATTGSASKLLVNELKSNQLTLDLILLDIGLPDSNPEELAGLFQQLYAETAVVIVSGQEAPNSLLSQPNVKGALMKPLNIEKIKKLLSDYI